MAISFLTKYGRFLARVQGPVSGNVLLRREQYRQADSEEISAQWAVFRQGLIDHIKMETDSLRLYFLGANWQKRIEHVGAKESVDQEGPLIV